MKRFIPVLLLLVACSRTFKPLPGSECGAAAGCLTVTPADSVVTAGRQKALVARGALEGDPVIWSVDETDGGTIDAQGVYRAPDMPGIYHVTATSERGRVGHATVTVVRGLTAPVITTNRTAITTGRFGYAVHGEVDPAATRLRWSATNGRISGPIDLPDTTFDAGGLGGLILTLETSNAADDVFSASILLDVIAPPPDSVMLLAPNSTTEGREAVAFDVAQPTTGTTYDWEVTRDGSTAATGGTGPSLLLPAGAVGEFTVRVWPKNAAGDRSEAPAEAVVPVLPRGASVIVGQLGGFGTADDTGISARFNSLTRIVTDAQGTAFVLDDDLIRRISPAGEITTVTVAPTGTTALTLQVNGQGVATALYMGTDQGSDGCGIRRLAFSPGASLEVVFDATCGCASGLGAPIDLDLIGNTLYVATDEYVVQALALGGSGPPVLTDYAGQCEVYAGNTATDLSSLALMTFYDLRSIRHAPGATVPTVLDHGYYYDESPGVAYVLSDPPVGATGPTAAVAMAPRADGAIYFADTGAVYLRQGGSMTVHADAFGTIGDIALSGGSEPLLVADYARGLVRRVDATGNVTDFAGAREQAFDGLYGPGPRSGQETLLYWPSAASPFGNAWLLANDFQLMQVTLDGNAASVKTYYGNGFRRRDGLLGSASSAGVIGVATSPVTGNTFFVDGSDNNELTTLRKIQTNGLVLTMTSLTDPDGVLANPTSPDDGYISSVHLTGRFLGDTVQMAFDAQGTLYIADGPRVRAIYEETIVSTLTQTQWDDNTSSECDDSDSTEAFPSGCVSYVRGLALSGTDVFLTDAHKIRRFDTLSSRLTTLAGGADCNSINVQTPCASACFAWPTALAADAAGNLFVADGSLIHRIKQSGGSCVVDTVSRPTLQTGVSTTLPARFNHISSLSTTRGGDLLISDSYESALILYRY